MKAGSIHDSPTKAPPFARFKSPSSPDANQQPEHNLEIEQLEALVVESQGTPNDEESIQRWIDWLDEVRQPLRLCFRIVLTLV